MKRVFIIHGWGGSPDGGWKPLLKMELEKRNFVVCAPQMPDTKNPKMHEWISELSKLIQTPDSETYLVGHSLGGITVLRYLESLKTGKAGGAVLIGTPIDNRDIEEISTFFENPIDWKKIKTYCRKFISINSDDDYYIPISHGEKIRNELGSELIVKKRHKHFSGDDGFTELPVALESVLKLAGE